jgi:hypothetical protein
VPGDQRGLALDHPRLVEERPDRGVHGPQVRQLRLALLTQAGGVQRRLGALGGAKPGVGRAHQASDLAQQLPATGGRLLAGDLLEQGAGLVGIRGQVGDQLDRRDFHHGARVGHDVLLRLHHLIDPGALALDLGEARPVAGAAREVVVDHDRVELVALAIGPAVALAAGHRVPRQIDVVHGTGAGL